MRCGHDGQQEVLDQLLSTIDEETLRDKGAEALTRESTELAEVRGQRNDLVETTRAIADG